MSGAPVPNRVSTVLPVYERPALLEEAVAQVLAQTHPDVELVIVDDGSGDGTGRVAQTLARAHPDRIRVVHTANRGPGAARARGVREIRGEYVQFLDSDDAIVPEKFALQVAALRAVPEAGVCYGGTRRYRRGETPGDDYIRGTGIALPTLYPALLRGRIWATSTPLYRREVVQRAGDWPALWAEEDWLYDMQVAALGVRLVHVDAHLCDVCDHDGIQLHRDPRRRIVRYRSMAHAREAILDHALALGARTGDEAFDHFLRALFHLARECGALGLAAESRRLVARAREASERDGRLAIDLRLYDAASALIGARAVGRLCAGVDAVREQLRSAR